MKNKIPYFVLLILIMAASTAGCKKAGVDPDPVPPETPEEPNEPIRIEKRIYRHLDGSALKTDTFSFEYDMQMRVTQKHYPDNIFESYTYTSDKLTSIKTGSSNELLNFVTYSSNGDTIVLDFSRPDATGLGADTVQLTYIYSDSLITEFRTYLHSYLGFVSLQKQFFEYNASKNLISKSIETLDSPRSLQFEVLAWDDKVNPLHGAPKLNQLFLDSGLPLQSFSLHNPTKYKDAGGTSYEIEMTYNAEGYPLTAKMKGADFVMTELIYNR